MMDDRLPVSILTGFLGAGKTTFLNRLLKSPEMAGYAVIINEFGDVALDHLLVEKSDDGLIELSSGCICCSMRGELVDTLERLVDYHQEDSPLKGIIIETSGAADPVPVLNTLLAHPFLSSSIKPGAVLTLVDAAHALASIESQPVYLRQIALADRLLVSKCDLLDDDIPSDLLEKLQQVNLVASIEKVEEVDLLSCLLPFGEGGDFEHRLDHARSFGAHAHNVESFSLIREEPIKKDALMAFLELLASAHGSKLLRVKGFVLIEGEKERPLLVNGVQAFFHAPVFMETWPDEIRKTRLVFIVDGIEKEFIERLFDGFCSIPRIDGADKQALTDNPLAISGFPSSFVKR